MFSDLMMQHLHVARVEEERQRKMLLNEQLRIAGLTRPSLMSLITDRIGTILITAGESLRREKAAHTQAQLERIRSARTA
jgi:hypothetical protein